MAWCYWLVICLLISIIHSIDHPYSRISIINSQGYAHRIGIDRAEPIDRSIHGILSNLRETTKMIPFYLNHSCWVHNVVKFNTTHLHFSAVAPLLFSFSLQCLSGSLLHSLRFPGICVISTAVTPLFVETNLFILHHYGGGHSVLLLSHVKCHSYTSSTVNTLFWKKVQVIVSSFGETS